MNNPLLKKAAALFLSLAICLGCFASAVFPAAAAEPKTTSDGSAEITKTGDSWLLQNDILSVKISFADGSIKMDSFYNKSADKEYLTADDNSYLFSYTYGEYINGTKWTVADYKKNGSAPSAGKNTVTLRSDDGNWTLGESKITDITMTPETDKQVVLGKQLEITLTNAAGKFETRLVFGVYNDEAGFHYQNYVKNTGDKKMVITESDVISLSFPGGPHYLHYVNAKTSSSNGAENATWKTATGGLPERTGRNALCVYTAGDGFWIMPETNWRTQSGPQTYGSKNESTNSFNEFASTSVAVNGNTSLTGTPIKVACIGDSITEGVGSSSGNSYPSQLQRTLGSAFEVKNFGVSARTLLKKGDYPYWNESAFTQSKSYQPDIVIIMLGTNDSKPQNWKYKDEYKSDYLELINQYKSLESNPKIYIATSPIVVSDSLNISASVVRNEIVPLQKEIAEAAGCEIIDIFALSDGHSEWFTGDHVHPNDLGYSNLSSHFAEYVNAYNDESLGNLTVKVSTNPESLQLTLKPGEEFQYIGVNLTLFKGDVVDGKMAAEEHFQKRFQYRDTSTILNSNDWDYIGKRSYDYFEETIVPLAKQAGIEMVMIDDLWNVERDGLTAINQLRSLSEISDLITDNGMMFGLWFSMNGGDHNNGRDLADPDALAEKIAQVEELASTYNVSHQMIDLTELWQNVNETEYSSPCDNVYRKNVMVNNALNGVVEKYPHYMVKLTNEVDVYPTQGNRQCGLLHIVNNGWVVHNAGLSGGMAAGSNAFGYLPLSSVYSGGNLSGDMSLYYHYLYARNVKLNEDPGTYWTGDGIDLAKTFNTWRHGERVDELLDQVKRPTYLGAGWDSNDGSAWISSGAVSGPYSWMYTSDDKDRALMIATSYTGTASKFTADTRWLDSEKQYMVADVTLDDIGSFTYAYKGVYSGAELIENGFEVDLTENTAGGKAFWFEAVGDDDMQVIYANEAVTEYSSSISGDKLNLAVKGEAGATATVIVGDSKNNTGRVINLRIGESGNASVSVPRDKLYAPEQNEKDEMSAPVRLEIEDLYKSGTLITDTGVTVGDTKVDDSSSVGASGGDYRIVTFPKAGDSIGFPVNVPADGTYIIRVQYKSHNNQALSAIGVNGVQVSDVLDLSTGALNKITVQECKATLKKGDNVINVICTGKGAANSGSSLTLRVDCVEIQSVIDADPEIITGKTLCDSITAPSGVSVTVNGDGAMMSAEAPASYITVPITAEAAGSYSIDTFFTSATGGAVIQAYIGNKALTSSVDLYSASANEIKYSLGSLDFTPGETKYIDFVIMGRNASNTSGYTALLNRIELTCAPSLSADKYGIIMKPGETFPLGSIVDINHVQPAYDNPEKLSYLVSSESNFDVAEVKNGIINAGNIGTAVITVTHKSCSDAAMEFTVSVVAPGASQDVLKVMEAINTIGTVTLSDDCNNRITAAEQLYNALSDDDKAGTENYYLLKTARAKYNSLIQSSETETLSATNYLEDLDFSYNNGSTVRKGSCPSGSHKIQFTEDGKIYEHGIGFEPTDKVNGTIIVPIPTGADHFYAKVGLDYAMSQNPSYDEGNTVSISVDGKLMGQTGKIVKNYKDGKWVDNSYEISFDIPEGAKWLLIDQNCGSNRMCDHILLADAKFENKAAAAVQSIIDSITPENVNISKYSDETGKLIAEAEAGFYALTEEQQALIPGGADKLAGYRTTHSSFGMLDSDIGAGLTAGEKANVEKVNALVNAIPAADKITKGDTAKVDAAKAAYEALSDKEKYCVTSVVPIYMGYKWIEDSNIPAPDYIKGDVDDNGTVNVGDIMSLKNLIMNGSWTDEQLARGDMNNDNNLTVGDMLSIKNIIMGS